MEGKYTMHANTEFRSNPREYVMRGLDILLEGLTPFIEGCFQGAYGPHWQGEYKQAVDESREWTPQAGATPDVQAILKVMLNRWDVLCRPQLDWRKRDLAHHLLRVRNDCMHQQPFSVDDAYRALDGVEAMLAAITAPQRGEAQALKGALLRDAHAAPTPPGPTVTPPHAAPRATSPADRHPRLRRWLGPMADDLLADIPYHHRALRIAGRPWGSSASSWPRSPSPPSPQRRPPPSWCWPRSIWRCCTYY